MVSKITNPMAKELANRIFSKRVVQPKKGKGSYKNVRRDRKNELTKTLSYNNDE